MIEISMTFKGNSTKCSASYVKKDEVKVVEVEKTTGADALDRIIGRLSRARLGGMPWFVRGTDLNGVIPAFPYRPRQKVVPTDLLPGVAW
jgi:hypothetical protein